MSAGRWLRRLVMVLAAASGCGGASYIYGPLGNVVAQPKPKDCDFLLALGIPVRAYDALGVLAPRDIEDPQAANNEERFKSAVREQVCAAGGDAVLVERDARGHFIRGTVIRLR